MTLDAKVALNLNATNQPSKISYVVCWEIMSTIDKYLHTWDKN